jgi:hypothetical protein
MVRYKVKPEFAQDNERLVRAVYDELAQSAPAGLRYATYKLDDDVSFVHLASIETDDGHNPLEEIAAFKRFQEDSRDLRQEPAVSSELREIGSYRMSAR